VLVLITNAIKAAKITPPIMKQRPHAFVFIFSKPASGENSMSYAAPGTFWTGQVRTVNRGYDVRAVPAGGDFAGWTDESG